MKRRPRSNPRVRMRENGLCTVSRINYRDLQFIATMAWLHAEENEKKNSQGSSDYTYAKRLCDIIIGEIREEIDKTHPMRIDRVLKEIIDNYRAR